MSVYFIQAGDTGLIKIGHARSVTKRLAALQTGSAHNLRVIYEMRGGLLEEQGLHAAFAKHRAHGEWFHPHSDIFNHIAKFKGEERPKQNKPTISPFQVRRFNESLIKFIGDSLGQKNEDGEAAMQLMMRFLKHDPEIAAFIESQKKDVAA